MSKPEPRLSLIIVSYNTRSMTLACLRSIYEEAKGGGFEVIVLDNASNDGSAEAIATEYPTVTLIRSGENLGFARANNVAARKAAGRYILLLNPDTVILDSAVDRLMAFAAANPGARMWGGRTVFADGSLNPTSCWRFVSTWSLLAGALGLAAMFRNVPIFNREGYGGWRRDSVREVEIVTGCLLLIERDLWIELGGFDERFFMYGEEADLCFRARQLGARPLITPDATIVHHDGASEVVPAERAIRMLTARVTWLNKHWPQPRRRVGLTLVELSVLLRVIGHRVLSLAGSQRHRLAAEQSRIVWSARHRWRRGYAS